MTNPERLRPSNRYAGPMYWRAPYPRHIETWRLRVDSQIDRSRKPIHSEYEAPESERGVIANTASRLAY